MCKNNINEVSILENGMLIKEIKNNKNQVFINGMNAFYTKDNWNSYDAILKCR